MATRIMYVIYVCLCSLVFSGAPSAYHVLVTQFEQRDLAQKPEAASEEYRRTVPVVIPGSVGALPAPTSTQEAAMP